MKNFDTGTKKWTFVWLWNKFQAHTSDVVIKGIPTLEDLGIQPATMESRMPWEVRATQAEAHYMEQLGEFDPPAPPKTIPLAWSIIRNEIV